MHLACNLGNAKVVRCLMQNGGGRLLYSCGSIGRLWYPISHVTSADAVFTLLEFHPELAWYRPPYTASFLSRAADDFIGGKGGWTLDRIKQLVEVYGCTLNSPEALSPLTICFINAASPNARALFWYLARERKATLTDPSSALSHFRALSNVGRIYLSEAEAFDDLMRYLIVERGLEIDEAGKYKTALSIALRLGQAADLDNQGPAALLIRWGASLWPALLRPDGYRMLSSKGAATIKDAIRQRAYTKRARLIAAYRYPRKHSNVRRWETEEEKD
jgi:hypothetical protein